jgi:hypothetical protein
MTEEPNVAESDQLAARLRDVLEANHLELIAQSRPDPKWIEQHTAGELLETWLGDALVASEDGALSCMVAVRLNASDTAFGFTFCIVRRKAEESA